MVPEGGKSKRQKLGEMLLEHGLITSNHLKEALKVQSQTGGRLGSILVQLGYVTVDTLIGFLCQQFGVPSADLFKLTLDPSAVRILPFDTIREYKVIPVIDGERSVTVAMVDPNNFNAIHDLEFKIGRPVQPVVVPQYQIETAIRFLDAREGRLDEPVPGEQLMPPKREEKITVESLDLNDLFKSLVEDNASDLLLSAGVPPSLKKDNEVKRLSAPALNPQQIKEYARELMSEEQRVEYERFNELDFAYTFRDIGRFRINIYKQRNSVSVAARRIVEIIPQIGDLGLPPWIEDFVLKSQGLILVTGPTGHGKTTTLAAMIDIINTKRRCNVITIEDPIEYLHKHKSSNVNQREVGIDTESFREGLRHIFRQAPDVIVIGEMRDPESFSIALQAAETGHLVLSTLHSNTATSAIDRIADIFPPQQQQQIRVQFAENFLLVLSQRLVPVKSGSGRVLAFEKLVNTHRVRNFIRDGKTHQIRSMLQQATDDFFSIDQSLARLCIEGKITQETGFKFCENTAFFTELATRGASGRDG